jgi:FkbM family methyltransferase
MTINKEMTTNESIMNLEVQGITFQLLIPDDNSYAQIFQSYYQKNGNYEAVMVALLTKILESLDKPVFVDLGAFIGYYTFYCARLLAGKARVYSVESNAEHIEILKRNMVLNGCDNIEIIHAALSSCSEPVKVSGNSVSTSADEGVELMAETLDSVCHRIGFRPNVAKMDVHGFEGKILGGMTETLHNSLEYILLELHPNVYLEKYTPGITRMQILDSLEAAGFTNYYVAGHRYTWSDGMRRFFDTGQFAYQPLNRKTRGMLLFDRHNHIFVLACKPPLEKLIGPSVLDPSLE